MEKRAKIMSAMTRVIVLGKTLPRRATALHGHSCWELVLYLSGRGETVLEGRAHPFEPGTAVLIPPRVDHEECASRAYQSLWMQFHHDGPHRLACVQDPEGKPLARLAALLLSRWRDLPGETRDSGKGDATLFALADALVCWVSLLSKGDAAHPAVEAYRLSILSKLRDPDYRVQADPCQGLSPQHLARLFKSAIGSSPRQYLLDRRLDEARALLALGGHSVSDVSRRFGFRDPFHFSKAFRRRFGYPPREARGFSAR